MEVRILHRGDIVHQYYEVTGSNIALRLVHELTGYIWDTAAAALSATTAIGNSDIAMTEKNRLWSVALPATLPIGRYIAQKYLLAGSALYDTDEMLSKEIIDVVP